MSRARALLGDTDLSVAEVAARVGMLDLGTSAASSGGRTAGHRASGADPASRHRNRITLITAEVTPGAAPVGAAQALLAMPV